jgi:hypothetical protein
MSTSPTHELVTTNSSLDSEWRLPDSALLPGIVQRYLNLPVDADAEVTLIGEGAFNWVYSVTNGKNKYVMRLSLPVEIPYKTMGEISTYAFLRQNVCVHMIRKATND